MTQFVTYAESHRFKNGWFCKICDRVTEHKNVKGHEVCLVCGFVMGNQKSELLAKQKEYRERPDVKAKQKEYRERPDVKAKQKEYYQRPDVKAKQKEYHQRPDVKAKKKAHQRQRKIEKLEKKLQALKMEAA